MQAEAWSRPSTSFTPRPDWFHLRRPLETLLRCNALVVLPCFTGLCVTPSLDFDPEVGVSQSHLAQVQFALSRLNRDGLLNNGRPHHLVVVARVFRDAEHRLKLVQEVGHVVVAEIGEVDEIRM